jgi:hypothetical protein
MLASVLVFIVTPMMGCLMALMITCLLATVMTAMTAMMTSMAAMHEIVTNQFVKLKVILNESLMQAADQNFRFFIFAGMQFDNDTGQFFILVLKSSHFFQLSLQFSIMIGKFLLLPLKPLDFQALRLSLYLKLF